MLNVYEMSAQRSLPQLDPWTRFSTKRAASSIGFATPT